MSSCRASKPTRTLLGLATLAADQTSIPARSTSSNVRSRLPVRSQHISASSTVAIPAQSATTSVSRRPMSTTASASAMPKKIEDPILKHVEPVSISFNCFFCSSILGSSSLTHIATGQLRKTRAAQATYKTASAFAKPRPAAPTPAQSRLASRPVSRPASRVPSSTESVTSSSSSARIERSIDAHIERVSGSHPNISPCEPLSLLASLQLPY